MPREPHPSSTRSEHRQDRRRAAVSRLVALHMASVGGNLADALGHDSRQRLVWLALLSTPLLLPVALPGMGSLVGAFCLVVAGGLCAGRPWSLPARLGDRTLDHRVRRLLAGTVARCVPLVARWGRPRLLGLSHGSARWFNGLMLAVAGLSMMVPVPVVSFDNVLPALAMVLMAWGLRLRDGLLLLLGHAATLLAAGSVLLLWWGGASLIAAGLARLGVHTLL